MFEVGKFYRFKMWEPGSNGGTITEYVPCKILEVDPPLVKIGDGSGTNMIVNTAWQAFVSASEVP